ncbi:asparagine synthase (glutamine-hydrolyzing) [Desulfococcaceae bacterium HSG7]|nr:asparagine synthase (glutamine-hydrolyzing) [Desulfococcaceae bacterium HSG7]
MDKTEENMCGIAGIVHKNKAEKHKIIVQKAIDIMAYRGPDGEGIYCDENVCLGHKRLAIIDIEGGRQPMLSSDDRYVLIYNGELYNYIELKAILLKKGYQFETRSDTEVLLYWLAEYGIDGLINLNGMFALGFWDVVEKTFLMARDRLGIKPLYYLKDNDRLLFASEIKAILCMTQQRNADFSAIYEFLTFQNILSDQTFFQSIRKLMPGHWLRQTPSGVTKGMFWDIEFVKNQPYNFQNTVEEYRHILEKSVDRHMLSDVPVGAYLSGGIDSSTVATVASSLSTSPVYTFTGAFTDGTYYDERIGSRAVAKSIGAVTHEIEITPDEYIKNIGKVIYHLDEPTLGTGAFPQYMVSRLVSRSVKVVLTGHGGDEMFGGYQVYKVALLREALKNSLKQTGSVITGIKKDEWTRVLYYLLYPFLYPEVGAGLFIMVPKKKRGTFFSKEFMELNRDFEPFDIISRYTDGHDDLPGDRILRLYLKTYLPTLFIQEDKVSMAHSIEARTPLCDNEMVDFALKVPLSMKLWNNTLKAITKAAMQSRLPAILYSLPKRGFPTPFAKWYRTETHRELMEDLLFGKQARERGIFNTSNIKKIYLRNLGSKTDTLYDYARANQLYSCSIIELWFRTFIDLKEPAPVF